MATLTIEQMSAIAALLEQSGKKLIYIAGASASGKSYFAKLLQEDLEKKGKKVLSISSDDYYGNLSSIKYLLYGTFDHPNLIDYDLLQKNIDEYLTTGKTTLPKYSFVERRRIASEVVNGSADFIIVEWLYTIAELNDVNAPFKIFVDSHMEEMIFRRIIRDQQRVKEPVDMIVTMLGKVFPMRRLYGEPQKAKADLIVENNYEILSSIAQTHEYTLLPDAKRSDFGELIKREYITDYMYNDSHEWNGCILISEVYREKRGFLDAVMITKRKADDLDHNAFHTASVRMSHPWLITQLHTLMQIAGMQYLGIEQKIISVYEKDGKQVTIKEARGKMFEEKDISKN